MICAGRSGATGSRSRSPRDPFDSGLGCTLDVSMLASRESTRELHDDGGFLSLVEITIHATGKIYDSASFGILGVW